LASKATDAAAADKSGKVPKIINIVQCPVPTIYTTDDLDADMVDYSAFESHAARLFQMKKSLAAPFLTTYGVKQGGCI
jgi:hypothetical protein